MIAALPTIEELSRIDCEIVLYRQHRCVAYRQRHFRCDRLPLPVAGHDRERTLFAGLQLCTARRHSDIDELLSWRNNELLAVAEEVAVANGERGEEDVGDV